MHTSENFLPEDPILYATLVKCGLSTIEAAEELARKLQIEARGIKFAGIKDKHAITSQLISVKGSSAEKLNQVSSQYYFIKNVHSGNRELYLGALRANQFTILIRTGPDFKKEDFLERLKEIEKNGFFNFYYLQRFGVPRLISHYCGLHILKGDYQEVVFTEICKPGEREALYFQKIRQEIGKLWGQWEEMDGLLESFPITFQTERRMLNHLIKNPSDFLGALNQVPHQISLWADAFASLLFNKLLSFYIQQGKNLPETLPLALGPNQKDWSVYEELLKQAGIFSATFALKNLKNFSFINRQGKQQKTIENIKILNQKIIPGGVILSFILPKGCYATTFLSHILNLVSGNLPSKFTNLPIDTKANLNEPSLEEILNKFSDVVSTPAWRFLWRIY
jgi:TruD family tRNA pseudouridine synthase